MAYQEETKKEAMYKRIHLHGVNLNNIFHTDLTPVELCKKLRRIETIASRIATKACNEEYPEEDRDIIKVMHKVDKLLNYKSQNIPVFFNGDPRGYTLKICDKWIRDNHINIHKDWGGYGIIAPDLTEE